MELDNFKTMMNVRERMTYFLRFQRMAGSENWLAIDEELSHLRFTTFSKEDEEAIMAELKKRSLVL